MVVPNLTKEAKFKLHKNHHFKLLVRPEDIEICLVNKGYVNMKITQILYKGNYYEVKCIDKNRNELIFLTYKQQQINNKIGIK
jgi:ABC-type Fe3+/spermidine/putrescine transport system ATPase subunit